MFQPKPVKAVRPEREEVGRLPHRRESRLAQELDRRGAAMRRQIELDGLRALGQVLDDQERLVSLVKSDLREYTILTVSPMPSYKTTLTDVELADVVAYLLSLKGR